MAWELTVPCRDDAAPDDAEGNPERRLVEVAAVPPVIVLAETFTVICGEHHQEIFVVNRLPDPGEEASDGLVHSSNLGVVAIFLCPACHR